MTEIGHKDETGIEICVNDILLTDEAGWHGKVVRNTDRPKLFGDYILIGKGIEYCASGDWSKYRIVYRLGEHNCPACEEIMKIHTKNDMQNGPGVNLCKSIIDRHIAEKEYDIEDLYGLDPDFTEGKTVNEFLREQRKGCDTPNQTADTEKKEEMEKCPFCGEPRGNITGIRLKKHNWHSYHIKICHPQCSKSLELIKKTHKICNQFNHIGCMNYMEKVFYPEWNTGQVSYKPLNELMGFSVSAEKKPIPDELEIAIEKATKRIKESFNDPGFIEALKKSEDQLKEILEQLARESRVDPGLLDIPIDLAHKPAPDLAKKIMDSANYIESTVECYCEGSCVTDCRRCQEVAKLTDIANNIPPIAFHQSVDEKQNKDST